MAEQDKILLELFCTSHQIQMDLIQDIMHKARKQSKLNNKPDIKFWDQIIDKLWIHLNIGFKKFDDQLLCATCFYTVIRLSNKLDYYMNEVLKVIDQVLVQCHLENSCLPKPALAVSMMYGLFQSPFLIQKEYKNIKELSTLLATTFNLLVVMGYEYTQYTFIVFKTIKTFKKVCGTQLQEYIFNRSNQISLLHLVNHNWENPITGVRDNLRAIFHTLISTVDEDMYTKILDDINGFCWNKAKYLMLSEIIEFKNVMPKQVQAKNLIDGLICSLHKPGLVSAGADMYYALLKTIQSEEKWCDIFLGNIREMFKEYSTKCIENFSNYWCLATMKTFPNLMYIILDEVEFSRNSKNFMFNSLCIMKQGNKLGLLDNQSKVLVIKGLEDINPKTRMFAFDILCMLNDKMLPKEQDYQLILQFIYNNINTDCTVLRLGMLGSINCFLTQLHVLYLNNTINDEDESITELIRFCKQLQELIISSVIINGNYQRKITNIKLCSVFITAVNEVHKKKRDQTRQVKKLLVEFLKERQSWLLSEQEFVVNLLSLLRDPADDIRDSTIKLLLNHYLSEMRDTTILNNLIENALKSMKSKFFYEISCGQSMFRLICNLFLKNSVEAAIFKNIDDLFNFSQRELLEFRLHRNIVETIEKGKQMHTFISILLVVLETCICHSQKLANLDDFVHKLLHILEQVTKQFSWDYEKSTSSDFSKMNDMIQDIINKSGHNTCDDETKISGLHQIVLNCLWLNVKASCDLAAILIQYYTDDVDVCKKCIYLITHVLETSRHKGVIEAAGFALGKCIQHLTHMPENSEVSELPMVLLKTKLNEIMSDTNKMSSITRRGAGLSIMVHRIVSSDMRREKPLFHHFMRTLLKVCNKIDDLPTVMDNQNMENQNDLPKALYIHFLTRIVTDSSLASDMMYYSTELSALAFSQMISSHWQIRNAALQLYGALVPKLVGQKQPSGIENDTVATVACDELRTHFPRLWLYILEILQSGGQTDLLLTHSNFVPILNMLGNTAKRYNFSYDMDNIDWEKLLLQNLIRLLGSPIFTVRRLSAKCIFNIYSFDDIFDVLSQMEYKTENLLHGTLMVVEISHKYYSSKYQNQFEILQEKLSKVIASGRHYYLSKEIFENLFWSVNLDEKEIVKNLIEVCQNNQAPGIFQWAHNRVKKFIMKSQWEQIPAILETILNQSESVIYCEFICEKLDVDTGLSEAVVKELVQIIMSFVKNKSNSLIWKILYKISLKFNLTPFINVPKLIKCLINKDMYKLRFMIPLIARNILNVDVVHQTQFMICVSSLSDPDNADVDMRHITVTATNEIAKNFNNINDSVRVTAIKTAVVFLQDEDDDLRNLGTYFYMNLVKAQSAVHAYICLNKMLDPKLLVALFDNPKAAIEKLCQDLDEIITNNMCPNLNEYNPFANDVKNIYLEADVLKTLILKLKNTVL